MAQFDKRRAFGQHFLKDQSIARLIAKTAVDEARAAHCQGLLEIGPGKGAITLPLVEEISASSEPLPLTLAERDRELVQLWQKRAEELGVLYPRASLRIEEGDFLDLPEDHWLRYSRLAVASNLPYSAGTAIVVRLARHPDRIPVMVLMFQAEVAHRLRAEPDTKDWGSLSVWIQNRWDVKKLCAVPPRAFAPPPKVDSEVVVFKPRAEPRVAVPPTTDGERIWEQLLKLAFAHRRKMLRSGFPRSGPWRDALVASGIDETLRAEALNWDDWRKLFESSLGAMAGR